MGLMLDSSVMIAAERLGDTPEALFTAIGNKFGNPEITISVIAAAELLHGCWRAKQAARRARREQFVEEILASVLIVPVDLQVARTFAELDADFASKGTPLEMDDLLIASSALVRGDEMLTGNAQHFIRIPGLVVHEMM